MIVSIYNITKLINIQKYKKGCKYENIYYVAVYMDSRRL